MDKCKECKHTIFTGKNIFEKINEINNKEIIDKYTIDDKILYNIYKIIDSIVKMNIFTKYKFDIAFMLKNNTIKIIICIISTAHHCSIDF